MTRHVACGFFVALSALSLLPVCAGSSTMSGSRLLRPEWSRALTSPEQAVADKHGFVIGPADAPSYHLGYTALFKAHKAPYFTADAMLHAVHRSFDQILATIELVSLQHELATLLAELRAGLLKQTEANAEARGDADLYLTVAASLLAGKAIVPEAGADAATVAELRKAATLATGDATVSLFGKPMQIDTSMFKPRGHYAHRIELQRYFRALMWLGRIEIRIAELDGDTWQVNRRAYEASLLIAAAQSPTSKKAWQRIDQASRTLVGPPDSMSFGGLDRGLAKLGGAKAAAAAEDEMIANALQPEAVQRIGTQMLRPGAAPIAFLLLGQRYLFDSHVLSAVTYGQLPIKRMMPSPLDVGHAVFHNPAATELLRDEFARYDYREALDAIRDEGDKMGPELWDTSITHTWLQALRELSFDESRDAPLPAVMKTPQWQRRMLNTQLASWAELRHDILLYAKQSVTAMAICGYPDAYVEPYPRFFEKLAAVADRNRELIAALDFREHKAMRERMDSYFSGVRKTMLQLASIAENQRKGLSLSESELDFLNHAVSLDGRSAGCTTVYEAKGWYADLYFDTQQAMSAKPIIADVHTQPTDEVGTMVGKVLHVATGKPRLLEVEIETPQGSRTFRGFVASYYEHTTTSFERLNDQEWNEKLRSDPPPDVPWLSEIAPSP